MPEVKPELWVEGPDDQHALVHLLIRNGVDYDSEPWPPIYPKIKQTDGVTRMLQSMRLSVQISTGRPIGFVLDADSPIEARWSAVRDQLRLADVVLPDSPPEGGFIGSSAKYRTTVGVWLMPDNRADGTLEDFLSLLVSDGDQIIGHAESATDMAKGLGAVFTENDRLKAVLHAWLAWQEEPGLPYGTAVRARYFRHDHALVQRFVDWFKSLYGIAQSS